MQAWLLNYINKLGKTWGNPSAFVLASHPAAAAYMDSRYVVGADFLLESNIFNIA